MIMDLQAFYMGECFDAYTYFGVHLDGSSAVFRTYAPTSRYGTASQLMELIDRLHNAGIGAIMDFVPVHFTVDEYGLKLFDGTPLYEYPHQDVGQSEWGSCNFNHSRREVACLLQSAANYWLKEYHFDGLRMDAVSRLLYWQGDEKRGEPDWELLKLPCHEGFHRFIQQLNHLYQHERCLWNLDHPYAGFKWADRISHEPCVFGYTRTSERQTLLILLNFSNREAALSAEWPKEADVLLHTDWECFGGSTPAHDMNSFVQTIPPFSGLICELPSVTSAE